MLLGDVKADTVVQQLEQNIGSWKAAEGQPPKPPPVPVGSKPVPGGHHIFLYDSPGLQQATVLLAEPGIGQTDPDVYALDVLGSVLNGLGGVHLATQRSLPAFCRLQVRVCVFIRLI